MKTQSASGEGGRTVPVDSTDAAVRRRMRRAVYLFGLLLLAIPMVAGLVLRLYGPEVEREAFRNLEAVAKLKGAQLENWLAERDGNAAVLHGDEFLKAALLKLLAMPQDGRLQADIVARLEMQRTHYQLSTIAVLDANFREIVRVGNDGEPESSGMTRGMLDAATRVNAVQRSDLYRGVDDDAHMQWVIPVRAGTAGRVQAFVVARVDAKDFVYRLIQEWPTASESGEALLARKNDDQVVFLNEFRNQRNTALRLTMPLESPDLPAAAALRAGGSGVMHGRDYRGLAVLAAYRPVDGTDWVIVAKIDHAEVVAPLYRLTFWVSLVTLVAVASVGLGFFLLWREYRRHLDVADMARAFQTELAQSRLQDANRQAMARAQMLIDGALDAVITVNSEGKIIGWNAQAEPIFGYATEDALGRDMAELIIPPQQRQAHRDGMQRYLSGGSPRVLGRRIEVNGMRNGGACFPMELSVTALEQGPSIYFSAYVRDLTAHKQAQESLERSMRLFAKTFNASPIAASIADIADGRFIQINANFSRDFGYSPEQLINRTSLEVQLWSSESEREAWVSRLLNEGRVVDYESQWRHASGSLRDVSISAEVTELNDKTCVMAYIIDITQRRAEEAHLKQLSMAIDQSPASVAITNLKGEIEWVNATFERSTGYTREEALGQNPRILQSGKTPQTTFAAMWQALTNGQEWSGTLFNRRKDGSDYVEAAKLTPIRNDQGQVVRYMATKEDITEKSRMAQELERHREHLEELVASRTVELQEARAAAEAASRAKSAFLANMSHEIRTPMNAIVGFAHLLRRANPTPEQEDRLSRIEFAAKHLLSLINDVLDLSKIEAGKLTLEQTDFHVGSLLDNVYSLLLDQARAKGLELRVDPGDGVQWLRGDSMRIRQALLNYAGNAIKFTESGSVVIRARTVSAAEGRHLVRFEVQDTGVGVPADKQERLFNAFEQADTSTTRQYGGTGLGLAITRKLAQMMGGGAGMESVEGMGSTFWFSAVLVPALASAPTIAAPRVRTQESELRKHAGARILLADDVDINREIVQQVLQEYGIVVEQAENGALAVEMARGSHFDLVLMDLQMPVLDGFAATRQIHAIAGCETLPVIAMTANAFEEDRAACFQAGMVDFVAKPLDAELFFRTLLKWLPERDRGALRMHVPLGLLSGDPSPSEPPGLVLDVDAGLRTWRDETQFARFLHKFVDDHAQVALELAELWQRGDRMAVSRLAHKLKGAASNLALLELTSLAAAIDRGIKEGEDVAALIADMGRVLQRAHEAIAQYAPFPMDTPDEDARSLDPERRALATDKLRGLAAALDSDNLDLAESVVSELEHCLPACHIKSLRAALTNFDFRAAEVATHQILASLETLPTG